jgi:hypothetical protein
MSEFEFLVHTPVGAIVDWVARDLPAGAIDSLSTITTPPTAATAKYYNDCLVKKQITAHIVAEEMKAIVQTRPELRPKPATGALLQSLIKLCAST